MLCTVIRILDAGDKGPAFPEVVKSKADVVRCQLDRAALLQGGMESGKPSVAFSVDLPDGKMAFIETSYANFELMAAAFRGAVLRWEEGR